MSQSVEERVQAQYGKQARMYSTSRVHATGDTLELLVALADLSAQERVLDVATGTGFTAMAFAPHVREVLAYDLTAEMLAEASRLADERGLNNMRFQQGPAEQMPFAGAEFDVVTARVAPHHFASVPRFVAESFRVLKAGGRLLIADTSAPDDAEADRWENEVELLRDPSHVRDYNQAEWRGFMEQAGFQVLSLEVMSFTELGFGDWVKRSGSSEADVRRLCELFAGAPASAVQAFSIHRDGEEFTWSWPVVVVNARKP